jgi:5-methylcytosine-specific restriction endonuclease McrA
MNAPRRMTTRVCLRCGRGFQVWADALKKPSRCPEHRGSSWDRKPPERDLVYMDPTYRRNRLIAIEREPTCHWRLPGCTIRSTTGDHVVPVSRGGSNDLSNLVGACFRCNMARGRDLGNDTKRRRNR